MEKSVELIEMHIFYYYIELQKKYNLMSTRFTFNIIKCDI